MNRESRAAAPVGGEYGRGGYAEQGGRMSEYGPAAMPGGYGGREMMGSEFGRGGGGYGEMAMGRGAGAYENLPDKPWDI